MIFLVENKLNRSGNAEDEIARKKRGLVVLQNVGANWNGNPVNFSCHFNKRLDCLK